MTATESLAALMTGYRQRRAQKPDGLWAELLADAMVDLVQDHPNEVVQLHLNDVYEAVLRFELADAVQRADADGARRIRRELSSQ